MGYLSALQKQTKSTIYLPHSIDGAGSVLRDISLDRAVFGNYFRLIQFVFDDLAARVERYPNDLRLRYELGLQYYNYEYYDEAVVHLQLAQKSPKERLSALYYLAMCFMKKGQRDMAVMQLETCRDQLPTMDELKKQVVYELGLAAEETGDFEKAYNYYKDIYSTDVTFGDLNERMVRLSRQLQG
jgi:tetratricopeptide (TPR) repeat protein